MFNRVSINIVTWNSMAYLPQCLRSIKRQTYSDFSIVVVDNDSDDGSTLYIEKNWPDAKIIINQSNEGFSKGHNIAIKRCDTEYVLPLNPDVELTPTYIEELVLALENDRSAGIAVGKLYVPDSKIIDGAGLSVSRTRRQYLRGHSEKDKGAYNNCEYVFGADGSAPLYRHEMLEQIRIGKEYFDEDFFAHKEDLDLSWRSQLAGWKCVYVPTAIAYHDRSFKPNARKQMSDEVKLHAVKNRYLAIVKNDILSLFLADLPFIIWYDLKILVYLLLFEQSSLRGIITFIRLLPNALSKRRIIMSNLRVSSSYMRSFFK